MACIVAIEAQPFVSYHHAISTFTVEQVIQLLVLSFNYAAGLNRRFVAILIKLYLAERLVMLIIIRDARVRFQVDRLNLTLPHVLY